MIQGRFGADPYVNYGCFCKLGVLFVSVLLVRALLFRAWRHVPAWAPQKRDSLKASLPPPTRFKRSALVRGWGMARARARARARAPYASIINIIGAPFLRLGGRSASFQVARCQRITEPPPEPSLCASEVLLMLLMPHKASKTT